MQRRFYDILIYALYIAILQLREVRKAKGIPESKKVIRQAVGPSAGIGLFLRPCIHRKLSCHDAQFDEVFQVDTGFGRILQQRFLTDLIEPGAAQGHGFDDGVIDRRFSQLLVEQEFYLTVKDTALC